MPSAPPRTVTSAAMSARCRAATWSPRAPRASPDETDGVATEVTALTSAETARTGVALELATRSDVPTRAAPRADNTSQVSARSDPTLSEIGRFGPERGTAGDGPGGGRKGIPGGKVARKGEKWLTEGISGD